MVLALGWQSCFQVAGHYGAGLQPFLVLPVSFPGASPRAGMGRASGPLPMVRIADAHALAPKAPHISRCAQSCGRVAHDYAAGLQPFLVLPVSFPLASPRAGMGRASGPLLMVRIADAHALAPKAPHISRRAQSCGQVGRHYGAGLQPFLVLPVSFPGASPRAGMGRASGPLPMVRIADAHA